MWTELLRALLLQCALAAIAAVVARRAKVVAILFGAAAALVIPWFAGPIPLFRGISALIGWVGLLRVIDVVRIRASWTALRRVIHVMSFVDSRTIRRAPPRIDFAALGRALLWASLASLAFYVSRSPRVIVQWAGGLVLVYAGLEAGYALVGMTHRAMGFVTPPLHVLPLASLSVGELWGERWARPVSAWLRETCFRPLVRRGHPTLGFLLGFLVSALGHAYPILVASNPTMAAMMLSFFLVQAFVVVIEVRLGTTRWSRAARRAWTIAIMTVSSPLFVVPALRLLG